MTLNFSALDQCITLKLLRMLFRKSYLRRYPWLSARDRKFPFLSSQSLTSCSYIIHLLCTYMYFLCMAVGIGHIYIYCIGPLTLRWIQSFRSDWKIKGNGLLQQRRKYKQLRLELAEAGPEMVKFTSKLVPPCASSGLNRVHNLINTP